MPPISVPEAQNWNLLNSNAAPEEVPSAITNRVRCN